MENREEIIETKKSNVWKILTILIMVLIIIGCLVFICVKFIFNNDTKEESNINNNVSPSITSDTARDSSIENPLIITEWGKASKRVSASLDSSYMDTDYVDIPIRVTKIIRGKDAEELVKEWFKTQKTYRYEEPKTTTEWLYVEYEVDYNNLKFKEGGIGTSIKINSELKGIDGGSIKHNNITYLISTKDISDSSYKTSPGIYNGKFVSNIPIGCTDYLIKLGDGYNKTTAFIKGQ